MDVVSIRLVKDAPILSRKSIREPIDVVELLGQHMCELDREVLCVINLRADNSPINCNFVSIGALDECLVHPRELLKSSILSNAASIIIIHNHPSGNLTPSKADTMTTDRMLKLGNLIGIPLLDHIIVGGDNQSYFSFKSHGIMSYEPIKLETEYMNLCTDSFADEKQFQEKRSMDSDTDVFFARGR